MNRVKTLLAATIAIALAFTVSCSSDDGEEGGGGGGSSVTYEGETYKTVVIGEQTWMAKNLNSNVEGSKCYGEGGQAEAKQEAKQNGIYYTTLSEDEVQANCNKYGRLYDWSTAMALPSSCNSSSCSSQINAKHKGICPTGWHIPSDADLNALITAIGGSGTKLRAKSGWEDLINGNSGNGTDDYGFSALPGGYATDGGLFFYDVGRWGGWWSATEDKNNASKAHSWSTGSGSDLAKIAKIYISDKSYSLISVRCIKD
jgi:uncharacterized protein (TIGR02145 family)